MDFVEFKKIPIMEERNDEKDYQRITYYHLNSIFLVFSL